MSRILVEYLPSITSLSEFVIKHRVTESMTSHDGKSKQFQIGYARDCLKSLIHNSNNALEVEMLSRDITVLDGLISEGVHYIEL